MKKLLLAAGLVGLLASLGHATLVNPGSSILTPNNNPAVTGTLLASSNVAFTGTNSLGQVNFTGHLISSVYKETTGFLTFYYQVTNDSTSVTSPSKLNVTSFGSFTTDVDSITTAAGDNLPVATDRLNPSVLAFTFGNLPVIGGMGVLLPGTQSTEMVVRTNATAYSTQGSAQVIDGAVASVLTYVPVPEPSSMMAIALGGAALIRRRNGAKK